MYKILVIATFLACTGAIEQATSFASFNDNHNHINHIHSAPVFSYPKYSDPASSYPKYSAPASPKEIYPAAPALTKAVFPIGQGSPDYRVPEYHQISQYSQAPAPKLAIAKVATVPVVAKAPVVPKYDPSVYSEHNEEYAPAQYEFSYVSEDSHTGDYHSHQEHRDGDHVVGQYSLHEADGTVRLVKYSDDGHGFNAVVERHGHPTEAPVAYKKLVAVPAVNRGY
ncbi:cuticle protein 19-like [Euwallacea fornicatus]|uniref:cuticle protein 19-like n=1 Tax=Euwallacea fornicatus TaxID=995702 RepID=UPI00339061C1